jgi:hypothetical protein
LLWLMGVLVLVVAMEGDEVGVLTGGSKAYYSWFTCSGAVFTL